LIVGKFSFYTSNSCSLNRRTVVVVVWNALTWIGMKENLLPYLFRALIPNVGSKTMSTQTLEGGE